MVKYKEYNPQRWLINGEQNEFNDKFVPIYKFFWPFMGDIFEFLPNYIRINFTL